VRILLRADSGFAREELMAWCEANGAHFLFGLQQNERLVAEIASELDGGKYVTIVSCHGVDSPPPVRLAKPGTPLTVSGVGPSAAIFKMLKQADPYKNIYTCTVVVKEKVPAKPSAAVTKKIAAHQVRKSACEIATGGGTRCTKKVTLNTGFGGLARQVKHHHPAG